MQNLRSHLSPTELESEFQQDSQSDMYSLYSLRNLALSHCHKSWTASKRRSLELSPVERTYRPHLAPTGLAVSLLPVLSVPRKAGKGRNDQLESYSSKLRDPGQMTRPFCAWLYLLKMENDCTYFMKLC